MKRAERVARTYIEASNRGDHAAMADLFHTDAEWIPIAPIPPRRGAAAIRERYLTEVKAMNAPIIDAVYTADDQRCIVEFRVDHPEQGLLPIVDVFTVDDHGRITRLAVYRH